MKKRAIYLARSWLSAMLVFLVLAPGTFAEELQSGGKIDFNVASPEGENAKINFSGQFSGNGEMNVFGSVYSMPESQKILDADGNPAGMGYSRYSEAELNLSGQAEKIELNFFGNVENETSLTLDKVSGSAKQTLDFNFNGCSTNPESNIKISGWTSINHSQDQRYMGAETSGTTIVSGNLPVTVSNVGTVNVSASDQIGSNFVRAQGSAKYNLGANTTGFARSEAGTWMNQDGNRMSVTAFVNSTARKTQANNQ